MLAITFSFIFRKLTDKPKDEPMPAILSESIENLEEIGKGNTALLPIFDNHSNAKKAVSVEESETKQESSKAEKNSEPSESAGESHMVMHRGALIDVGKLLQQLNRSEKAREETELRLIELAKANGDLQSNSSKAKDKIKDLQSELKSYSRKINDADSNLSSANVSHILIVGILRITIPDFTLILIAEKMRRVLFDSMRNPR